MKFFIATIALLSFFSLSHAEETMGEKAKATGNSAQRGMKKGINRTAEAFCGKLTGESKAECLVKRAKTALVKEQILFKTKPARLKTMWIAKKSNESFRRLCTDSMANLM